MEEKWHEEEVEEEQSQGRLLAADGSAPVQAGRHLVGGGGSDIAPSLPLSFQGGDGRGADKAAAPPLKVKQRGDRQAELMAAATLSHGRTDGRWVPVLMAAFSQESQSCHLVLGQFQPSSLSKRPAAT